MYTGSVPYHDEALLSMNVSSMHPLIKIIPVTRRVSNLSTGIPRPMHLIRPMLVSPRKDLIEIATLMRRPHAVDTHAGQWLEGSVCMAHESLSNVVKTVIAVKYDFLWLHICYG